MVTKIDEVKLAEILKEDKYAVIDFYATWCGPCRMLGPVTEELSEELAGKVDFYMIDTDENPNASRAFNVSSIPLLVLIKNGKIVDTHLGFEPINGIREFITKNLK